MANTRHLLAQVEGAGTQMAAGLITDVVGTPTLGSLSSPQGTIGDFSVVDNGVGDTSLVIANFAGPLGFAVPTIALISSGTFGERGVKIVASSYSGDTYTIRYRVFLTSTGVAADGSDISFQIFAF